MLDEQHEFEFRSGATACVIAAVGAGYKSTLRAHPNSVDAPMRYLAFMVTLSIDAVTLVSTSAQFEASEP